MSGGGAYSESLQFTWPGSQESYKAPVASCNRREHPTGNEDMIEWRDNDIYDGISQWMTVWAEASENKHPLILSVRDSRVGRSIDRSTN